MHKYLKPRVEKLLQVALLRERLQCQSRVVVDGVGYQVDQLIFQVIALC